MQQPLNYKNNLNPNLFFLNFKLQNNKFTHLQKFILDASLHELLIDLD